MDYDVHEAKYHTKCDLMDSIPDFNQGCEYCTYQIKTTSYT